MKIRFDRIRNVNGALIFCFLIFIVLHCFPPRSDVTWTIRMINEALESLLEKGKCFSRLEFHLTFDIISRRKKRATERPAENENKAHHKHFAISMALAKSTRRNIKLFHEIKKAIFGARPKPRKNRVIALE